MQNRITDDEVCAAAQQLAKSQEGRDALQRLGVLLGPGGFDLDLLNQRAFLALLGAAWRRRDGLVREVAAKALAESANQPPV